MRRCAVLRPSSVRSATLLRSSEPSATAWITDSPRARVCAPAGISLVNPYIAPLFHIWGRCLQYRNALPTVNV